jgi:hypothetical protein
MGYSTVVPGESAPTGPGRITKSQKDPAIVKSRQVHDPPRPPIRQQNKTGQETLGDPPARRASNRKYVKGNQCVVDED